MKIPDLVVSNVCASPEGKLADQVRGRILAHLRTYAGVGLDVVIRQHRDNRSLPQNAWIWGVAYPLIAETLGYDKHEHDDLHYALVAKCFGVHHDDKLGADVPNARSSKLTTAQFSEYMDWLVRFAAQEWGCVIPLPDEQVA
jgi:hypothetical protein